MSTLADNPDNPEGPLNHGLTGDQVERIKRLIAPYADEITRVELFGSRAKGTYRLNSDVDLVLHGPVSEQTVDRLWSLFAESNLPFKVDLKAYALIDYPPLKAHIDQVGRVLFTQADLNAAPQG